MQKIRGRWALTMAGLRAVQWLEQSLASQKAIMGSKQRLRVATTTWLAEQVLIPTIDQFRTGAGHGIILGLLTSSTLSGAKYNLNTSQVEPKSET